MTKGMLEGITVLDLASVGPAAPNKSVATNIRCGRLDATTTRTGTGDVRTR